jgi:penicillin-binding protein 1A
MKRSVKILWRVFFGGMLLLVLLIVGANYGLLGKMPSIQELQNPEADLASEVYTSDGKLMGKYYAENRSEVKYSEISTNIINALIATEDVRFKEHSGIDGEALARAVFKLGSDGGGSTLTQQVAKMMLKQGGGGILQRIPDKIKEWIVAVKLERNFTKEELIALYLNRAPWGNLYGIRNASRAYFQKEPKDLNIEEAAVLVGMLKGFIYDPIRHPAASLGRRNTVIGQMQVAGYITPEQAEKLKAKPLITNYKKLDEEVGIAPYFRSVLADTLRAWCKTHINPKTNEPYNLYRDGLKIYTTINSKMQQYAEESVVQHMPVIQRKLNSILKSNGARMWKGRDNVIEAAMKYSERWKNFEEEGKSPEEIKKTFYEKVKMKVFAWNAKREMDTVMTPYDSIKYHKQLMQTSFVAMEPKTGAVKCWVGGIDYKWFKFDHVTANRQVGSTFKPLLYTLAVQDAGYTPETPIAGGAISLGGKTIVGGGGTMAYCLAQSKNAAAYRLMQTIGVKRTIEFAQACGVRSKIPPYPSIALGSAEIPMLQMLQSYTMFPNKGYNTQPVMLTRIEDKNGNLLQEFIPETKQVISEADAYTMVKLMQGVVQSGTGRSLNGYGIPVKKAGKTGTTNDNTDGWFIGYTPELLAGTWVGCDDPFLRLLFGTTGGNEMALPKWGYFMKKVYADKGLGYGKIEDFDKPAEIDNNPIYADQTFADIVNRGDGSNYVEDAGNGDAGDFVSDPAAEEGGQNDFGTSENIPIESDIKPTAPAGGDTGTAKKPEKKPEEKKEGTPAATVPPVAKPGDKKPAPKPDKPKPAPNNDYR